ncbi:MAG: glycosyltransferase family 2 protein [candidate division Zixibacteria bacterium]|nr:glycosyltransferase family 2 protein [candidate division Zixibacteria bacterium]
MSFVEDSVSIIIVTHNSLPLLRDCLDHLKAATPDLDCEVVVVDNDSSDHSASVARHVFGDAVVLANNRNLGFAVACNQGAAAASGEYLLFLNPDLLIDSDAIRMLKAAITSTEKAGAVTGRLRFPDGVFQPNCRHFPTVSNLLFSRGSVFSRLLRRTSFYTLEDCAQARRVPAVAGTMLMVRSELFRALDGFDERFFMYMEDTDLCYRIDRAGYANYYVPDAGAVHLWAQGSRAGRVRRNRMHHLSVWKYFRKHRAGALSTYVLPIILPVNFILVTMFRSASPGKR